MIALWEIVLVSVIVSLSLFLGFLVYFRNRKEISNKIFLIISTFSVFWIVAAFLSEFFPLVNPTISILLSKITYISVIWWVFFLLFFTFTFPQKKKVISSKFFCNLFIFIIIIFSILIGFTSLLIKGIKVTPWGFDIIYGAFFNIFSSFTTLLIIIVIINLIKNYLYIKEYQQRKQLKYFILGFVIFLFSLLFFNVGLFYITGEQKYYRFGNYSSIFFLGFTAYAIVAKQLFDIRVILTEILIGFIALFLFIQAIIAETIWLKIITGIVFILFCLFGYYLIKATLREIQLRQEIERLSKAKSEFISIASHQLRTPLTVVKGYISMILEKTYGAIPEKMKKPMENVYESNERLIKLVNDLLNISRLEAGKLEFKPESISVLDLVKNIVEELKINAEKKGLYLKIIKPSQELPKIMADKDKLRQVILNLIDNAIKYTKEGGITVEVKHQISNIKNTLLIIVTDTGMGMTQEEIGKLFEMFSRASAGTQLNTMGTGIGLHVAKKFVEMHNGRIWAESEGEGKGSRFIVELPVK